MAESSLSPKTNVQFKVFANTDFALCPDTRRSILGFCVFIGNSLVSWKSKKQQTVLTSSTKVECRAMTIASCELTWLLSLLKEFGVQHTRPTLLYCDNQAALHI